MPSVEDFLTAPAPKKQDIGKSQEGGVNMIVLLKSAETFSLTAEETKNKKKQRPAQYRGYVLETVTVKQKKARQAAEVRASASPRANALRASPPPPRSAAARCPSSSPPRPRRRPPSRSRSSPSPTSSSSRCSKGKFAKPPKAPANARVSPGEGTGEKDLRAGMVYVFRSCVYELWKKDEESEPRISFMTAGIAPCAKSFAEIFGALPFCRPNFDRDFITAAGKFEHEIKTFDVINFPVDNDKAGFAALCAGENKFAGQIVLPDAISETNLFRSGRDPNSPDELAFTDGMSGTKSSDPPRILAFYQAAGDADGKRLLIYFGGYEVDWLPLQLSLASWKALAKYILPAVKGHLIGSVNRGKTHTLNLQHGFHGMAFLWSNLVLDVPTVVERAGVEIGADDIKRFIDQDLNNLRAAEPATGHHPDALNLSAVDGNATQLVKAVAEGAFKAYVLANHNLKPEELAKVKALEPAERVAVLLDEKDAKVAPKYVAADRDYAVYIVGRGPRQLMEPAAKRGR